MHPDDAKLLGATSLFDMEVYLDEDFVLGEPEIVSPEEATRWYGRT